jgi:tetraacyldisaccharide 4''-kinase
MTRIVKILENIWYRDKKPTNFLIVLSMVYGILIKIRRLLYDLGIFSTSKPEIPVIIIGNINVGGTGKTPFTLYLANRLSHLGKKVGIVSRGYRGKKSSSKPFILDKNSKAEDFGDEAVYLLKNTDSMVCVCKKRLIAANLLFDRGVDIILSDDGLQHYALGRDIEFAVVSSNRGFGNRYLLPAGPLRER